MTTEEAAEAFGFDPNTVGLRNRGWHIVPDNEDGVYYIDSFGGDSIPAGCLVVEARDGAGNKPDPEAFRKPNYVNAWEDEFDRTYRYYVFSPLTNNATDKEDKK